MADHSTPNPMRPTQRRRPLYTCGTSILTTIHNIYKRIIQSNGPVGSLARRLASFKHDSFANILIYVIQYQWLAILSFADERILSVVNFVESRFPPSRYVFDGLDNMVRVSETLPEIVDDGMTRLPVLLHKVPFLNRAVMSVVERMDFVVGVLSGWGMDSVREKDINVVNESSGGGGGGGDVSCPGTITTTRLLEGFEDCSMGISPPSGLDRLEDVMAQIESESSMVSSASSGVSGRPHDEANNVTHEDTDGKKPGLRIKCSYKEALEKGSPEKVSPVKEAADQETDHNEKEAEGGGGSKAIGKKQTERKEERKESETGIRVNLKSTKDNGDPILELFETGWQTPKMEGQTATLLGSRSASYT